MIGLIIRKMILFREEKFHSNIDFDFVFEIIFFSDRLETENL